MESYSRNEKTTLKRLPKRAHYDRETIYSILDAGCICHVGYTVNDQAYVTPTMYWRQGNRVYWHGSSASRMIRVLAGGIPVCVTVTHFDAIVLARSAFHHSANYRSVMAFGIARQVDDPKEKMSALEFFTNRLFPGRWGDIRVPSEQEMKATTILFLDLEEVSAKIRTGPPVDDEDDYALPVWAGVLPISSIVGAPVSDQRLSKDTPLPSYLSDWTLAR